MSKPSIVLPLAITLAVATGLWTLLAVGAGTAGIEILSDIAIGGAVVLGLVTVLLFVVHWIGRKPTFR